MIYENLQKQLKLQDISKNQLTNGRWFIGSAIMGTDFRNLSKGSYFYYQDTVWYKALSLEIVNPYWELYNRTFNIMLIDYTFQELSNTLKSFLKNIKSELKLKNEQLVFFSSNKDFINIISQLDYQVEELEMKFHIEENVGTYSKLFIEYNGKFFPLIDFTSFNILEKKYFEINLNKTYVEMIESFVEKVSISKKVKLFHDISKSHKFSLIDIENNPYLIKLVSLTDIVKRINDLGFLPSSKYNGHVVKKILKEFYLFSRINNYNSLYKFMELENDYIIFLDKEEQNFNNNYLRKIDKYPSDILLDTYGISNMTVQFLKGELIISRREITEKTIMYYTDIPFMDKQISRGNFIKIMKKINNLKRSEHND
jgi:hypothetical protein